MKKRTEQELYAAITKARETLHRLEAEASTLRLKHSRYCRRRFSMCLDCDCHNYCPRYCKHRENVELKRLEGK
jgi:hypothetical protein